jgi:hemerythrin-like metal-binding protein
VTITYPDNRTRLGHEKTVFDEHRALAEQIDAVCCSLARTPQDTEEAIVTLQDLLKMAKAHFQNEEIIMAASNFAGRLSHQRDHAYLIQGLRGFIGLLADETVPVSPATRGNFRSWLTSHEKKYDNALLEFMTNPRCSPLKSERSAVGGSPRFVSARRIAGTGRSTTVSALLLRRLQSRRLRKKLAGALFIVNEKIDR